MSAFGRWLFVLSLSGLAGTGVASAQGFLQAGKTPAQVFASDCSICHKAPQGLNKGRMFGMESFLREHYMSSKESAGQMAAYLQSFGNAPEAAPPKGRQPRKPSDTAKKPGDAKPSDVKPSETKPAETKPADAKPADAKPEDAKPAVTPAAAPAAESKPAETKPAEPAPAEAKPVEAKPVEAKPADSKPADSKPQ